MKNEKTLTVLIPLLALILGLLAGAVIISLMRASPIAAARYLLMGAFGSVSNFGFTLVKATPLIFTSLCACFAYRCGIMNLGGEGQFIIGSVVAVWVATDWGIEGWPVTLLALVLGLAAGALWAAIPAILKIKRRLNEMIVSIMLNYVATLFMGWVYTSLLRDGYIPQTFAVPDQTKLIRPFAGMHVTYGFFIALLVAVLIHYYLFYTYSGFKLRAVGLNQTASFYNGFPVQKLMMFSFIVSGAIAGLGGACEVLGTQYRLQNGYARGFGFDGVAIALIAQLNPLYAVIVAYFFAVLRAGATTMQVGTGIPTSVVDIIQAIVIVAAVAGLAVTHLPQIQRYFQSVQKEGEQ